MKLAVLVLAALALGWALHRRPLDEHPVQPVDWRLVDLTTILGRQSRTVAVEPGPTYTIGRSPAVVH